MFLLIIIGSVLASLAVGFVLKRRLKKYEKVALQAGLSGKEVAETMLREYNIHDVKVISVEGRLTDHYNPANKTVNLSPDVYNGRNISAAAVAAHECGHAVQHATAYTWLTMRSQMVPIQNASGQILSFIFIAMFVGGMFLQNAFPVDLMLIVIMACYGVFTLFSFVTLPVEFDASNRAVQWLEASGVATPQEKVMAKDALKWAAMTYVVAALSSLAMLLYYVMIYMSRRN